MQRSKTHSLAMDNSVLCLQLVWLGAVSESFTVKLRVPPGGH